MIRFFGCETARELLPLFVDGELGVDQQVELETHLRSCSTCAAHVQDLRLIGSSLRSCVSAAGNDRDTEVMLRGLQAGVVNRLRAERDQSVPVRLRLMFEDLHVVSAGVGALAGVLACILLTMSVIAAIDRQTADSLAAIMETLSHPGSDSNPMSLDGNVLPPRQSVDPSEAFSDAPTDDAVFALATVVNRDGRIADYEVLLSHYHYPSDDGMEMRVADASLSKAAVSYVREAVRQTRFLPAQSSAGAPVAVNMVWLLTRTTVKAPPLPFDFDEFRSLRTDLRNKARRSTS
jgi:hypothetical protein